MNAQIRINKDTDAVEIFTGDKWVATYVQEDIDETQALWYSKGHTDGQKINTLKELTNDQILGLWDWNSGEVLATDILDFADFYRRALLGEQGLIK